MYISVEILLKKVSQNKITVYFSLISGRMNVIEKTGLGVYAKW